MSFVLDAVRKVAGYEHTTPVAAPVDTRPLAGTVDRIVAFDLSRQKAAECQEQGRVVVGHALMAYTSHPVSSITEPTLRIDSVTIPPTAPSNMDAEDAHKLYGTHERPATCAELQALFDLARTGKAQVSYNRFLQGRTVDVIRWQAALPEYKGCTLN